MEDLLTPDDVSRILGVPIKTLYRWRGEGYGPPSARIGRHLRYRLEDVKTFAEAQFTDAPGAA